MEGQCDIQCEPEALLKGQVAFIVQSFQTVPD